MNKIFTLIILLFCSCSPTTTSLAHFSLCSGTDKVIDKTNFSVDTSKKGDFVEGEKVSLVNMYDSFNNAVKIANSNFLTDCDFKVINDIWWGSRLVVSGYKPAE